jgi:hypothetical protein
MTVQAEKRMKTILLALLLSGLIAAQLAAEEKPTSLSDARAAIDANMQTSEGKAFDEKFGQDFFEKHMAPLRQCKQNAGDDLRSFWILAKLDKDGGAREILFYPETKVNSCAHDALLREKFLSPPRAAYWVSVYLKLSH